jgi:co-chaperonin GroES (HSP10)
MKKSVKQREFTPEELKLLGNDVYVEFLDAPASDIILTPDMAKDLPVRGRVLQVGPGRVARDGFIVRSSVERGDIIQFYFGAVRAYYPDRQHGIVADKNILALLQ